MVSFETIAEYEQRKINEVRDTAAQRQHRKTLRAQVVASRVPPLKLSADGDMLLFDGRSYNLFYAHGNFQVERAFTVYLQKKGYCSSTRHKIHVQVKMLVADSPMSCNIFGAKAA
jgi:hypothetical protein